MRDVCVCEGEEENEGGGGVRGGRYVQRMQHHLHWVSGVPLRCRQKVVLGVVSAQMSRLSFVHRMQVGPSGCLHQIPAAIQHIHG